MPDERFRCAAVSVRRAEPLQATASRVRRWLVVEQPGPWGHDALLTSRLHPLVARTLHAHGRRHGVRILLARRPGWRHAPGQRRVYLASTRPEGGWIEQLDVDDDGLLALDLGALRSGVAPGVGTAGPRAVLLVCTNGRHDPCCADLGRPVVRALDEAGVPDVWESSHVGGDRFAANVVALPSGVYLGRVPPERAPAIVADLAAGILDLDHYRGRSCYTGLVQAAEIAARRELGERRVERLVVEATEERGADEVVARLRHDGGVVEVDVRRRAGQRERLTCSDGNGRPWVYELVGLRHI